MLFNQTPQPLVFGAGIEDTFIPEEKLGQRKLDLYELTQHYLFWKDDLGTLVDAGAKYVRWGIPWYLVEPEEDRFDFSWVDEVAAYAKEIGLEIIVDLLHYGTPLWMENSFLNARYPERFARYAGAVAQRYKGKFTYFTPTNEPIVNAIWCGRDGSWPPYLHGEDGFVTVLTAVAKGMCLAARAIREHNSDAVLVQVDAGFRWVGDRFPDDFGRKDWEEWRFLAMDLMLGRVDATHPMFTYLSGHGFMDETMRWFADHRQHIDIMGVNYYPATSTLTFEDTGLEHSVEGGAEGLKDLLAAYWQRYHLPMIITETSRNESVESKAAWLHESVAAVDELRDGGIPVIGYTWFPFFDMADWSYRTGLGKPEDYWNPLGLVSLVRDASTVLRRVPTDAVDVYRAYATR